MVSAYRSKIPGWFLDFERFLTKMVISKVVTCSPGVDMKTSHWAFKLPVSRTTCQKSDAFFIGRTTLGEDVCGSNCP